MAPASLHVCVVARRAAHVDRGWQTALTRARARTRPLALARCPPRCAAPAAAPMCAVCAAWVVRSSAASLAAARRVLMHCSLLFASEFARAVNFCARVRVYRCCASCRARRRSWRGACRSPCLRVRPRPPRPRCAARLIRRTCALHPTVEFVHDIVLRALSCANNLAQSLGTAGGRARAVFGRGSWCSWRVGVWCGCGCMYSWSLACCVSRVRAGVCASCDCVWEASRSGVVGASVGPCGRPVGCAVRAVRGVRVARGCGSRQRGRQHRRRRVSAGGALQRGDGEGAG